MQNHLQNHPKGQICPVLTLIIFSAVVMDPRRAVACPRGSVDNDLSRDFPHDSLSSPPISAPSWI